MHISARTLSSGTAARGPAGGVLRVLSFGAGLLGLLLVALTVGLLEAWTVLKERVPAGWQPPSVATT